MSPDAIDASLETIRPEFKRCSYTYSQLRCLWAHWDYHRVIDAGRVITGPPQPSNLDVEPMLVRAGQLAFRGLDEVETWYFGDTKATGKGIGNAMMFFGDPQGAAEFGELARSAGGCLGKHTPDHLPADDSSYRLSGLLSNTSTGRSYRWCHAIFNQAHKAVDGSTLQADFVSVTGPNYNLTHAALHINPFLASLMLIDSLMDSGDQSTAVSDTDTPFMPAEWYRIKFGIPSARLRAARRDKRLAAIDVSKVGKRPRYHYSVRDAQQLWPEDGIYLPEIGG